MALSAGSRIGPYEIVEAIGAGGMGEVYRARDAKLARDVAIKVLPAEFALDPDRLARFTREAQVLASLNHQNIGAIYGLEESRSGGSSDPPISALVLEFVDGPTLADRIAQGAIPVDDALPIARQIAEALEAAHEQGIIHRDLKPANIKVRPDGTVKVLDFGLAKLAQGPGPGPQGSVSALTQSPTITTPAMTQVGMILGTAAYMSPEQAKGREADKRSDIWAFGCVLFEMLTGRRAFEGDDVSDTLAAVLRADVEFSRLPLETPSAITALLRRCLDRDAKGRLRDIGEARIAIERAIASGPAEVVTREQRGAAQPSRAWRAIPLLACTALGAVLAGVVAIALRPAAPLSIVTKFAVTIGQSFSTAPRNVIDVSPDGTQLVFVSNRQLFRKMLWEFEATPIAGSESPVGLTNPVFAPDGRSIAFITGGGGGGTIQTIPSTGGTPRTFSMTTSNPLGFGLSWSPQGILIGAGGGGILRLNPNSGASDQLARVKANETASYPQMLPDGDSVLYTRGNTDWSPVSEPDVVVHSLKSGEDKIIAHGSHGRYVASGHIVYAVGGVLFAAPFDVQALRTSGEPVAVVQGVRRGANGATHFSVSNTGVLVYVQGPASTGQPQRDLALIDRNGVVEPLKLPAGLYEAPRVSPDGKRIAFSSFDNKEGIIWTSDVSGANSPLKLTFAGRNRFPIWSPDNAYIAFQSDREGDLAIYVQRADGSGSIERLTTPDKGASQVPDSWSPDGEHLLFSETKDSEISSWVLSIKDKKVSRFGDIRSLLPIDAVFSPNGAWVAYQSGRPGDNGVFVQPFPAIGNGKYQISRGAAAHHPAWSRDGKEIIYIPAQANPVVVSVNTQPIFAFSKTIRELPTKGIESGPSSIRNYDVMPDGRLLGVVNAGESTGAPVAQEIRVILNWFEELKQKVPIEH